MTVTIRPPSPAEAEAIAALLNAHGLALLGESQVTAATAREWLEDPDITVLIAVNGSAAVCYGDLMLSPDGSRADLDVREHPQSDGVAPLMLAELERLAADRGAGVARGFADATEDRFRAELAERGYGLVRHFFRMLTPLDGEIEPPHWPAGIAVRTLQPGDERAVHAATEDAFADHWDFESRPYERWAKSTFENEHFDASLNFLALDGDEIAGVCLCAQHQSGEPGYGWVMTLGVRPRWRRRGLGLALLRHAFATFRERGFDRVGLGVDGENTTGAVRLYERAGMHVAHRHDLFEKTLSGTSP